jgi:hypothetical protein
VATYEEILAQNRKDQNAKAEEEYKKRAAANTEITNTYISDMNTIVDNAAQQSAGKIQKEIDALPTAYQSAFDANAIQQKINEREVRERMANLGLTDSGLNRTQQTAINIQRANADAALVQQKNAASNSLKQQIADIYASAENQKLEYAAKANADLKSTNESLRQSLFDAAESNAVTIANNWLDNETKLEEAKWDYKTETEKARIKAPNTIESSKNIPSNNTRSYDNGGYDSDIVKMAQKIVGASEDGKWGVKSSSAAKSKGYNSLAAVVDEIEKLADKAIDYYNEHPNVTLDSRTLDMWLHDNGISGNASTLFKAFLQQAGAKTSGRR